MVNIVLWRGGSDGDPTVETADKYRFKTDDTAHEEDLSNPIPIPMEGENYSYWIHLSLDFTNEDFEQLTNIRIASLYSEDWTGTTIYRGNRDEGDIGCPKELYRPADGEEGKTGYAIDDSNDGHPHYRNETEPIKPILDDDDTDPPLLDSTEYTEGDMSKAVVLQLEVTTSAERGTKDDKEVVFIWDII